MPNSRSGSGPAAVDSLHTEAVPDPSGWFSYRPGAEELSWSDSLVAVFGFAVGDVVPTLSLIGSHHHPQGRMWWDGQLAAVLSVGETGGGSLFGFGRRGPLLGL